MATVERIRKLSGVGEDPLHPALSVFESRCLCRRLADCEASVREAFSGACEARAKTHDAPEVVRLCRALEASLQQIGLAKRLSGAGVGSVVITRRRAETISIRPFNAASSGRGVIL